MPDGEDVADEEDVPGEEEQEKGRIGARLAQQWLNRTTRVDANLLNPDGVAKSKLKLKKANYIDDQAVFSFDLGGQFLEGAFKGQYFLAEVKNHKNGKKLPGHYRDFLAHCYRAVAVDHHMADQLIWIAFAPHGTTTWDILTAEAEIKKAVLDSATRDINFEPGQDSAALYSPEIGQKVSERLWLLVLAGKQVDHLTLTKDHHGVLMDHITKSAEEITATS